MRAQRSGTARDQGGARDRQERRDNRAKSDARLRRLCRNILIGVAVFVLGLVGAFSIADSDAQTVAAAKRSSASWQETTQGSHVISTIQNYVHVTEVWDNLITESGGEVNDFTEVSMRLFAEYGAYLQSLVVAPGGVVQYVYPTAGNEGMIGASLSATGHDDSYERAVQSGAATVSGVSNSTQGGQAFNIFKPVYIKDAAGATHYWGMVEAVVRFPSVFNGIGFSELPQQGYEYRLSRVVDGERETIIESDNAKFDDPVEYTFEVPNDNWTLALEPSDGWIDDDRKLFMRLLLSVVAAALGVLAYFVASLQERQQDFQEMSYVDALTGLVNARGYKEGLADLQDDDAPYAIFVIDANDFKHVNDTYGHGAGNVVLQRLGSRLASCVRAGDVAYRVGGDEFAIIARGMSDLDACARMADRIRSAANQTDTIGGASITTSVSVGYARHPADGATYEEVSHKADEAMYRDKKLFHAGAGPSAARASSRVYRDATDMLTGLPSIDYYRTFCGERAQEIAAASGAVAVAFIDVQDFKLFNLRGGYELGDRIIKGIADLLREEFPDMLCARFDADHFVVMAPAKSMARKLNDLHSRAQALGDSTSCEVKAGIYVPRSEGDVQIAHDRAKLACDSLKGHYDRWIATYDKEFDHAEKLRHHITTSLERALDEGWVEVWYQPIVRAITGEVCGAEALSRWHDPEYGEIPPSVFIPELERSRQVDVFDAFVTRQVCKDIQKGGGGRPCGTFSVSINISRADFELTDVGAMLEDALSERGIDRSWLAIEITESAEVGSEHVVRGGVRQLCDAGFKVWVDDFGTGHSTSNLLLDMRYDALKIDRAFLARVTSNEGARDLVSSVTDLAKRLSLRTVVEGVETAGQLAFAREIGIDMVQGYLFSKPRPLAELLEGVAAGRLVVEDPAMHAYYDAMGRVNLVGESPFGDGWVMPDDGSREGGPARHAVGMVEFCEDRSRVLSGGPGFLELLAHIGISAHYDPREPVPDQHPDTIPQPILASALPLMRRAFESGSVEMADLFANGMYGTCRALHVASCGDRHAFVISIEALSGLDSFASALKSQDLLHHLYEMFDRIDVFDPQANLHRNVYASRPYAFKRRAGGLQEALDDYARSDVHPDDRARWLTFFDFSTAEGRIAAAGGCASEYFRTLDPAGRYAWQAYYLLDIHHEGKITFLTCAKNVNLDEARRAIGIEGRGGAPSA